MYLYGYLMFSTEKKLTPFFRNVVVKLLFLPFSIVVTRLGEYTCIYMVINVFFRKEAHPFFLGNVVAFFMSTLGECTCTYMING